MSFQFKLFIPDRSNKQYMPHYVLNYLKKNKSCFSLVQNPFLISSNLQPSSKIKTKKPSFLSKKIQHNPACLRQTDTKISVVSKTTEKRKKSMFYSDSLFFTNNKQKIIKNVQAKILDIMDPFDNFSISFFNFLKIQPKKKVNQIMTLLFKNYLIIRPFYYSDKRIEIYNKVSQKNENSFSNKIFKSILFFIFEKQFNLSNLVFKNNYNVFLKKRFFQNSIVQIFVFLFICLNDFFFLSQNVSQLYFQKQIRQTLGKIQKESTQKKPYTKDLNQQLQDFIFHFPNSFSCYLKKNKEQFMITDSKFKNQYQKFFFKKDRLIKSLYVKQRWFQMHFSAFLFSQNRENLGKLEQNFNPKIQLSSLILALCSKKMFPENISFVTFDSLPFAFFFREFHKISIKTTNSPTLDSNLYSNVYFLNKRVSIDPLSFFQKIHLKVGKSLAFHLFIVALTTEKNFYKIKRNDKIHYQFIVSKRINKTLVCSYKQNTSYLFFFRQPILFENKNILTMISIYNLDLNPIFSKMGLKEFGLKMLYTLPNFLEGNPKKQKMLFSHFLLEIQKHPFFSSRNNREMNSLDAYSKEKVLFLTLKPSCCFLETYIKTVQNVFKFYSSQSQSILIKKLTPVILNYCNSLNFISNKQLFYYFDSILFLLLWRWACKKHPTKSRNWIKSKYFHKIYGKNWVFSFKTKKGFLCLPLHRQTCLNPIYQTKFQEHLVKKDILFESF